MLSTELIAEPDLLVKRCRDYYVTRYENWMSAFSNSVHENPLASLAFTSVARTLLLGQSLVGYLLAFVL